MAERREFHFVFGLRAQTEPFHVLHFLCLASCRAVNRPDVMHFHYRHEPHGPWWQRARGWLRLHRVDARVDGFAPERYRDSSEGRLVESLGLQYAHEADFLRLDALLKHGGVYADMDTLFVQRYPDAWFAMPAALGEENATHVADRPLRASLCNAVVFAQRGSSFVSAWRQRMAAVFDGSWSRHSCDEPVRVWGEHPDSVRVLPPAYFYRYQSTPAGLRTLLEENDDDHADLYSVHLWAHLWWDAARTDFSRVHAGDIDAQWIRERDCTLARLARRFLPADAS